MNIKEKVLLIEDERTIRRFMQAILTANGYDVLMAGTGAMADTMISSHCPDIIILDLGLPDMDGMTILRNVRKWSKVPILVVSARSHERDKVEALDAGADDYLVKPFAYEELLARIHVLARRQKATGNLFTLEDLTLDASRHVATRGGTELHLTSREYAILEYLIRNAGVVLSRDRILENVWSMDYEGASNMVDVYIRSLRKKVDDPFEKKLIHTVRGVGYVLRAQE